MRATILLVLLTVSFVAAAPHRRTFGIEDIKKGIIGKLMPFAKAKSAEVLTCIKGKAVAALKGLVLGKVQALFGGRRLGFFSGVANKAKALACKALKSKAVSFCQSTIVPKAIAAMKGKITAMLTAHKAPTSAVGPALECVAITAKTVCAQAADAACK